MSNTKIDELKTGKLRGCQSNTEVPTEPVDTLDDSLYYASVIEPSAEDIGHLHLVLPVYYTKIFATKPSKTFLIGMNWLRQAHRYLQNEVKQKYSDLITPMLVASNYKIEGQYEVAYKYYYKSKTSDLLNCGALISKYLLDSLQKSGVVQEDNVQWCVKECFYVAIQDRTHPRMEVFIREIKETT